MDEKTVTSLFEKHRSQYDFERQRSIWATHQNAFKEFWKTKIITGNVISPEADFDPVIKLIDVKARGFNREVDVAIARVNLPQGTWYRIFNDLVED